LNTNLLQPNVQNYINKNLKVAITSLVLKGSPFPTISITELVEQIESKKRCEKKLPTWVSSPGIYFPNKLNIEQTSSEATAHYKAGLLKGNSIIDITGGYGVDCFAFSKTFKQVTHCELHTNLSDIVAYNYLQLKVKNVTCYRGDGVEYVLKSKQTYDWIYIDPSRRNTIKGKVFLLKDCLPNVPLHLEDLLVKSNHILIKNSPLLDITSCINQLKYVKKIHVVALQNEVKEVLISIEKNYADTICIHAVNIKKDNSQESFSFNYQQEYICKLSEPLTYLYEPNSAILKSGGFNALCNAYTVFKLHKHSHLYTSGTSVDFPGRKFKVLEVLPYNKKKLAKHIPENKANITTRNFKENVVTIRKKTGIKEGGTMYLFFTTNKKEEQIVILCHKLL